MAGPGPSLSYPSVIMVYALREMEKEGVGELGRSVIEKRDTKNNCKLLPMEIWPSNQKGIRKREWGRPEKEGETSLISVLPSPPLTVHSVPNALTSHHSQKAQLLPLHTPKALTLLSTLRFPKVPTYFNQLLCLYSSPLPTKSYYIKLTLTKDISITYAWHVGKIPAFDNFVLYLETRMKKSQYPKLSEAIPWELEVDIAY